MPLNRIAIIGAGISGLTIANILKEHFDVVVYEKARGVGGRMSTRYAEPHYFDHGTQCFTARTEEFQNFLKPYFKSNIIAEWQGQVINIEKGCEITTRPWFEPHLVATPNMNNLCKKIAEGINIKIAIEVKPLYEKRLNRWVLTDKDGIELGEYDWVISTAPPEQTIKFYNNLLPLNSHIHQSTMQGCYALMIGLNKVWDRSWIAAKVRNNPIKWISVNSTKPMRNKDVSSIVVHSRNDWADKHIDDDVQHVQQLLIKEFEDLTDISCSGAEYISTHRWRYAIVNKTKKSGIYIDQEQKLAATGDWGSTSRIEEVWLNAMQLAGFMLNISKD